MWVHIGTTWRIRLNDCVSQCDVTLIYFDQLFYVIATMIPYYFITMSPLMVPVMPVCLFLFSLLHLFLAFYTTVIFDVKCYMLLQ